MSLFPAYADQEDGKEVQTVAKEKLPWQKNLSCPPQVGQLLGVIDKERKSVDTAAASVETDNASKVTFPIEEEQDKKGKEKHIHSDLSSSEGEKEIKKKKKKKKSKNKSQSRSRSRSPLQSRKSKSRYRDRSSSRSPSCDKYAKQRRRSSSRHREERNSSERRESKRKSSKREKNRSRSRDRKHRHRKSRSRSNERSISRKSRLNSESKHKDSKRENRSLSKDTDLQMKIVSQSKGVFIQDLQGLVKPENAFEINLKGDLDNLSFKTTHYTQLARYKVNGSLSPGGTKKHLPPKKSRRYFQKGALTDQVTDCQYINYLPSVSSEMAYIPIHLSLEEENNIKKKSQQSDLNPLGIYDKKTEEYLTGKGGLDAEENITSHDIELHYWQNQMKACNERLRKEPTNVPLWLEFVKFQDKAYIHLFREERVNEKNEKKKKLNQKSLAERKIAILDTAIKKNYNSTVLQYERLCIGQQIWDDKKLKQEWGTYLFNFPNKIHVWHQYLLHTQTHFTSFTLTNLVKTFAKCTERLQQMQTGSFLTHTAPSDIGKCMVDVAMQLAHVWRQAGYMERSVALFQALIEFNFFAPDYLNNKDITLEARLAFFEQFWDSRAPRFGEEGSSGWAQVMKEKQQIEFPEIILGGTQDEEDELLAEGGNTSKLWLALETSRERRHWLAWQEDPEDCEDAERMVPFEELAPHLFVLNEQSDHFYLMMQFFQFLGAPNIKEIVSPIQIVKPKTKRGPESDKSDIFEVLNFESLLDTHLFDCDVESEQNIKANGLFQFIATGCGPTLKSIHCQDYYNFVCRAVLQSFHMLSQPLKTKLLIIYIRVLGMQYSALKNEVVEQKKLKQFAKDIKKKVKEILKSEEFRSCIPLYEEYAKLEEGMGHFDEAENVYVLALSSGTANSNPIDISAPNFATNINLFTAYIKLQLEKEVKSGACTNMNKVIFSLCSLVNDEKFTIGTGASVPGVSILKAKNKFVTLQNSYEQSLFCCEIGEEVAKKRLLTVRVVFFHSLLQLLTSDINSACLMFDSFISKINDKQSAQKHEQMKPEEISLPKVTDKRTEKLESKKEELENRFLEMVYEDYVWLMNISPRLNHVSKKGQIPLSKQRSLLTEAVRSAPRNTKFLLSLAQSQTWRDLLFGTQIFPTKNPSIKMLVSQLLPRIQKTMAVFANTEEGSLSCVLQLESVLAAAVNHPPGRDCPLLWRLYLTVVAINQPKKLKSLIYTALFQCPGVKSVYLDCIRLAPSLLKEIVNLMGEKGIRVRLPLEELQVLTEAELDIESDEKEQSAGEQDDDSA